MRFRCRLHREASNGFKTAVSASSSLTHTDSEKYISQNRRNTAWILMTITSFWFEGVKKFSLYQSSGKSCQLWERNNVLLEASASVGCRRNSQSWVGFENTTRGKVNKWRWIQIFEAKNRKGHFFWLGSSVNCRGFPNLVIDKIIRLVTININLQLMQVAPSGG